MKGDTPEGGAQSEAPKPDPASAVQDPKDKEAANEELEEAPSQHIFLKTIMFFDALFEV